MVAPGTAFVSLPGGGFLEVVWGETDQKGFTCFWNSFGGSYP